MTKIKLRDPKMVSVIGIIGTLGYILDASIFPISQEVFYLNMVCAGLTTLALLHHWLIKSEAQISLTLSLFALILLINLISAPFFQLTEPDFSAFFIRNSLIFWVIMPLLGLTIDKKLFIGSAVIYLIQYAVILFLTNDSFITNSAITVVIVLTGYVYVIFYLLNTLEASSDKTAELIEKLRNTNSELTAQKEELNDLIKTKDKLFSIIAHDLRSPFMGITGLSQMIQDTIKNDDKERAIEYSKMITQSSIKTTNLFSNLLEWVGSQRGNLEIHPTTLDLDDYVEETLSLLKNHQTLKNIKIEKENTDIEVLADPNGLKTVLRNLISNALKFTPQNGKVRISTTSADKETIISISDTGIGIDRELIPDLFDPTSFVSTQGTFKEEGAGIGLSLCKELIDKHSGKIWIESDVNSGTTFNISFPKQKVAS